MKTLIITDLARSRQLDRPTMTAVRGGWKLAPVRQAPAPTANDAVAVAGVRADDDVTQDKAGIIGPR
jgi:hypothetical protein